MAHSGKLVNSSNTIDKIQARLTRQKPELRPETQPEYESCEGAA